MQVEPLRLVRSESEAKVARDQIAQRQAELTADVEAKLAARYAADHEAWVEITRQADALVKKADERIAAICRERGIPEDFRPSLGLHWHQRGENASKERRAELRKVAQTRIAAMGKAALTTVEAKQAEFLTELIAGGLESAEAKAFLASLPTIEQLMQPLSVEELEQQHQPLPRLAHDEY